MPDSSEINPFIGDTSETLAQNSAPARFLQDLFRTLLGMQNAPDDVWRKSTVGRMVSIGSAFLASNMAPELFGGNAVNIAQGVTKAAGQMTYIDPSGARIAAPGDGMFLSNLIAKSVGQEFSDKYSIYGAGKWDRTQLGFLLDWMGDKNWTAAFEVDMNKDPESQVQDIKKRFGDMVMSASESMKLLSEAFGTQNMDELVKIADKLGASSDPESLKDAAQKIKDYVKASGLSANEFAEQFAVISSTASALGLKISGMQAAKIAASAAASAKTEAASAAAEGRAARFETQDAVEFQLAAVTYGQSTFGNFAAQLTAMKYGDQKLTGRDAEILSEAEKILTDPGSSMDDKRAAMETVSQLAAKYKFDKVNLSNLKFYVSDAKAQAAAFEEANLLNARAAVSSGVDAETAMMSEAEKNAVNRLINTAENSKEWDAIIQSLPVEQRAEVSAVAKKVKSALAMSSQNLIDTPDTSFLYKTTASTSSPLSPGEAAIYAAQGKELFSEVDVLRGGSKKELSDEKIIDITVDAKGAATTSSDEAAELAKLLGEKETLRLFNKFNVSSFNEILQNAATKNKFLKELASMGFIQSYEPTGNAGEGSLRLAKRSDAHTKIFELMKAAEDAAAKTNSESGEKSGQENKSDGKQETIPETWSAQINTWINNLANAIAAAIAPMLNPVKVSP